MANVNVSAFCKGNGLLHAQNEFSQVLVWDTLDGLCAVALKIRIIESCSAECSMIGAR